MPRGGKRPGAGAPRGNTNAVKTGRHSARLRAIAKALSAVPEIRDLLLEAERRQQREQRKAQRLALRALQDIASRIPDENNPLLPYLLASLSDSKFRQN